jgi:hypothetical protein
MQAGPTEADRFTQQFYEQHWQTVRDHAEETGWAVVVDDQGRTIVMMHVLLEDLPPLLLEDEP